MGATPDPAAPTPCVAVAITDEAGRVLIGLRGAGPRTGYWGFPGGAIDPGEDFVAAAKRETLEETGLQIEPNRILNVVTNHVDGITSLVVVLGAVVTGGGATAGHELCELSWVDPAGPLPEMAFEGDAPLIRKLAADPDLGLPIA